MNRKFYKREKWRALDQCQSSQDSGRAKREWNDRRKKDSAVRERHDDHRRDSRIAEYWWRVLSADQECLEGAEERGVVERNELANGHLGGDCFWRINTARYHLPEFFSPILKIELFLILW